MSEQQINEVGTIPFHIYQIPYTVYRVTKLVTWKLRFFFFLNKLFQKKLITVYFQSPIDDLSEIIFFRTYKFVAIWSGRRRNHQTTDVMTKCGRLKINDQWCEKFHGCRMLTWKFPCHWQLSHNTANHNSNIYSAKGCLCQSKQAIYC